MKRLLIIILCGYMCTGASASAQDSVVTGGPGPVIAISEMEHGKQVFVNIFKETQRPYFHDPGAPRFLLMDRKNVWALGIGGYVQGKIEYDFGGVATNLDFYPAYINGNAMSDQYQMDASTSTVFLKLVGRTSLGNLIVYTAANWRGEDFGFHLQNAYVQYLGFTLGFDTGTFMDLAACPPTIDFAGPAGMTFYRTTLVRYEHKFDFGLEFCVGMEAPDVAGTPTTETDIDVQRMPDLPAYVQYGWNKGQSHVRLGGMLRSISYSDTENNARHSEKGYGLQASSIVKVGSNVQLFGQYTYGKGIGSMMNDIGNFNLDVVPNYEEEGRLCMLDMQGWYAGAQYNFTPNLFCSATYSQSNVFSEHEYAANNPTAYRRGQYLVGNVFWNPMSSLQLGVEYLHGWRKNFNDEMHNANRVNLSARFNF